MKKTTFPNGHTLYECETEEEVTDFYRFDKVVAFSFSPAALETPGTEEQKPEEPPLT